MQAWASSDKFDNKNPCSCYNKSIFILVCSLCQIGLFLTYPSHLFYTHFFVHFVRINFKANSCYTELNSSNHSPSNRHFLSYLIIIYAVLKGG